MNPFELRFKLLLMAKEIVMEEYYSVKDIYFALIEQGQTNKEDIPPFPTDAQIIARAKELNKFISDK